MNTAIIKPQWGPLTIVLMVLGFMLWWPIGLAMLAYIIWGEKFGGSADKAQGWMNRQRAWACGPNGHANWRHGYSRHSTSGSAWRREAEAEGDYPAWGPESREELHRR